MTIHHRSRVELDHVVQAACEVCLIEEAELVGPSRRTKVALCRQMAMLVARALTGASFPLIGQRFNRHHVSVIEAIDTARAAVVENPNVVSVIDRIAAHACDLAGAPRVQIAASALARPKRIAVPPAPPARSEPVRLSPAQRAELARLWAKGWSPKGLARRYEITEEQVRIEYKAETGRVAA